MGLFVGRWEGGRIRRGPRGTLSYLLERQVEGKRPVITLRVDSVEAARAELALFNRDPAAYLAKLEQAAEESTTDAALDDKNVDDFLAHLREGKEARSSKYVSNVTSSLAWWDEKLKGKPLRRVTLQELQRHLSAAKGRKHKIIHLKSFCAFLRARGLLLRSQDPTQDLLVPQARPEKARREKAHGMRLVESYYRATQDQAVRDVLCLRCKTGMHHTEVQRLAAGEGEIAELRDQGEIAGTIHFPHKRGSDHTISLDAQALAAAKRLRARGVAPSDSWMGTVLKAVATANRLDPLEQGALRHSYATWLLEDGVEVRPTARGLPLAAVAETLGHLNPRTTKMFYAGRHIPPLRKAPSLNLVHPADPAQLADQRVGGSSARSTSSTE